MVVFSCHGKLLNALCKTSPMTPSSMSTLDGCNFPSTSCPTNYAIPCSGSTKFYEHSDSSFQKFHMLHHQMPYFHFTPSKPSIFNKPAMQPAITSLGPRVTGRFHLPLVRVSFKPAYMTTICISSSFLNSRYRDTCEYYLNTVRYII